jgi:3-(3-hydroxy-phenyl)propionate hydroxylase
MSMARNFGIGRGLCQSSYAANLQRRRILPGLVGEKIGWQNSQLWFVFPCGSAVKRKKNELENGGAMDAPLVLIAGGGPSGMTLAIELRRAGLNIRVIDKAAHAALHSQALVVQARTLEQLQRYGLAERAVAEGRPLRHGKMYSEGKEIASLDLEGIPSRYPFALFLGQSKTEEILRDHLRSLGVTVEQETELLSFSEDAELVCQLRHSDGTVETVRPRWLVGCDGAHSTVRQLAGISFEGTSIELSFFLGDLELEGPDNPTNSIAIHLHEGNVVFLGRLTDRLTRVIVALHAEQAPQPDRVLTIADFEEPMREAGVDVRVKGADWMTPFYVNDRQANLYRKGSVFLAGDASHIHSPVGGQGMNTGMQDAANLAWKLAAVARGAEDRLLDSYQEERAMVGEALLRFTERGLRLATSSNSFVEAIRDFVLPRISSVTPVQKAMLGFVSETAITYRDSSIVYDYGGDGALHAGDRMPDLVVSEVDIKAGRARAATLLNGWTQPSHMAIFLNTEDDVASQAAAELPGVEVVSLHSSDLDDDGQALLGHEAKVLLLRPDGHIGFRGAVTQHDELLLYARQMGIASPYFEPGAETPAFLEEEQA